MTKKVDACTSAAYNAPVKHVSTASYTTWGEGSLIPTAQSRQNLCVV
jgi:hypothetical protein